MPRPRAVSAVWESSWGIRDERLLSEVVAESVDEASLRAGGRLGFLVAVAMRLRAVLERKSKTDLPGSCDSPKRAARDLGERVEALATSADER